MGTSASRPFPHHNSTADDVVKAFPGRARGKTVLVTGARAGGLGFEAARALAADGASVVLACRSQALCDEAVAELRATAGAEAAARASTLVVDLGSIASCTAAGAAFVARGAPLHVLLCNAGIMACPAALTVDGLEVQLGTNHFGHFALTQALLPALRAGAAADAPARVVNVSSVGHWVFPPKEGILWDDLRGGSPRSNTWARYGMSKLANVLHAAEITRRYGDAGVVGVSLHPGNIMATRLKRHFGLGMLGTMLTYPYTLIASFVDPLKSIPAGAATSVFCAIGPLEGTAAAASAPSAVRRGAYHVDCAVADKRVHPLAYDAALAARLWDESEKVVAAVAARA